MTRSRVMGWLLALIVLPGACSGRAASSAMPEPSGPASIQTIGVPERGLQDRLLVRQIALELQADDPLDLAGPISDIATSAGGYVDQSNGRRERLDVRLRIPVSELDSVVARIARLADLTDRRESARDVTEQTIDLEARLANAIALRDRLRQHLRSANTVQDIMAVEREIVRVQTEVEALEAHLQRLRSTVALAQLTVTIEQKRVLGPLGWVVAGAVWLIGKLFVIR